MIAPTLHSELAATRSHDLRESGRAAGRTTSARPRDERPRRRRRLQLRPAFGR